MTIGLVPRRLTTRLTLAVVGLLIPLALVVIASYGAAVDERRTAEVENAVLVGQTVAAAVDGFARGLDNSTRAAALALGALEGPLNQETAGEYIGALADEYGMLRALFLVDLQGRVLATAGGAGLGVDLSARPYIADLRAGKDPVWSGALNGIESGEITIALGRIVRGPQGAPRAFLVAAFYPDRLIERMPVTLPADASITLIDPAGTVLYSSGPYGLADPDVNLRDSPFVARALQGNLVRLTGDDTPLPGDSEYGALVPVPGVGWVVGFTRPRDVLAAALQARFFDQVRAVLVVTVLASGLMALIAQRLAQPLATLAAVASAIAAGARPSVPEMGGGEEVTNLARAMQVMRDAVADREETLAFLAEASALLASSLDYQTTLARAARLVVPRLADFCIVDTLEDDNRIRRIAVASGDPTHEDLARALEAHPPDLNAPQGVPHVLRTGQTEVLTEVPDSLFASLATNDEHLQLLRALGVRSHMIVPLVARGRTIGAITFVRSARGRPYSRAEVALAEDLASRGAAAIDNARLYREAQSAISARDEFLSVAAHELRTPITSMKLSAELTLLQMHRGTAPDSVRLERALATMVQQVDKLARLVAQLLDVSRLEGGQLALERERVDVVRLIENGVSAARAKSAHHELTVDATGPVEALLDPLRLEQVLANLLDNAMKFSPQGGTIAVEIGQPDRQTVCISVCDHGIGIPPDQREHIFDRFYQAHQSGHLGGMGLGLYISRQIVELHGGTIKAEFPEIGGTCFVLTLPTEKPLEPVAQGEHRA